MSLDTLMQRREDLANEVRSLGSEFAENGSKWPTASKQKRWDAANKDYDAAMEAIASETATQSIGNRLSEIEGHPGEPINPHNIGLEDVNLDGRVGRIADCAQFLEDQNGERHQLFGKKDSVQASARRKNGRSRDDRGLTLGSYLAGMVNGSRTESVKNALQEGSDSSGGFTVPEILSSQLIDLMRSKTRVMQAGAKTLILNSEKNSFAKLASDPVPAWRNELAAVNESEPTFSKVTFVSRSLAVLVKVSQELLDDSVNIGSALPRILAVAMAQEIDRVALAGTGVAPEPEGLLSKAGIATVDPPGGVGNPPGSFVPLLDAVEALESKNIDGPYSAILHPRSKRQFDELTDSTGQPLRRPQAVADIPMLATTMMPIDETAGADTDASSVLVGDFNDLLIGMRSLVRIQILKERFADTLEYGFLATLRLDVQTWRDESFVRIQGLRKV